jgi:urea transport system substrate-binding protein
VLSLSGPGTANTDGANQGAQLALDEINAGNLAGKKIDLITADDATDPRTAIDVCNRLVLNDKVDAIMSSNPTPVRIACNQVAQKAGLPHIAATTSPGNICFPNMFTVGQVNNQLVTPLVDYLVAHNMKKVYFFGSDYAAPRDGYEITKKELSAKGGIDVGASFVPLGTTDFAGEFSKIVAVAPDVVLVAVQGSDNVTFHRQFGNDPRLAKIKRADNFITAGTVKLLGEAAQGIYVGLGYYPNLKAPANEQFKTALTKKFGATANADVWAVMAYDGLHLMAGALKAGGSDHAAVIKALTTATFDGPNGLNKITDYYIASPTIIGITKEGGTVDVLDQFTINPDVAKCPS